MAQRIDKEMLYRKLAQTAGLRPGRSTPSRRLREHAADLERRLAGIEAVDTDAPPEQST